MQKRHFELIARVLKATKPVLNTIAWENTVFRFSEELAATNEHFDRQKFVDACGLGYVDSRSYVGLSKYDLNERWMKS